MSIRKYSTDNSSDNEYTNEHIGFNRAMLLSESQSLCMDESVNFPKEKFRSAFGFNSVKRLLRNNKKTKIDSDKESQDQGINMQNTATSLPVDDKLEVKVAVNPTQSRRIKSQDQSANLLPETRKLETKVSKLTIINDVILSKPTHIVSTTDLNDNAITHNNISKVTESTKKQKNYITNFDFYLSGADEGDNEDKLVSPSSDTSSNVWENVDDITANNLEMSNIWPALNVLDTTYPRPDGPTNNDNAEFMENLNKQFNYSPRRFTETLLTIIEESFVQSEQESEGLRRFLKKSDEAERFDDICMSTLVMSETSDQLTNVTNTDLHEPQEDSTQYMSFKKLTTSKVRAKTYRASVRLDIEGETSEIQRSKKINSINSSAEKKKYPKTPGFIKQRGRGKISPAHRQEVVTASSIRNSLRDQKNFRKTPEIIVHAATPQLQRKNRRMSIQSWDDDEYLTAESDSEESNNNKSEELTTMTSHESATVEIEEPVASSSRKLNMSSIAYHHQEWVQAYEKASKYQSVVHRSTTAQPKVKENHTKNLEKTWFQKLQRKRQQCLDLVEQHLEKGGEVDLSIEEQSPSECNSCKVTMKFINTLRACSAYLTCGMNMRDAFNATAKNKGYVSSLSMNIKKKNELRPHLSVIHHGRTKSSRKSLGKKNIRIASPGAKCLSPHSKSYLKRKSLEASKSPRVNSTSLRPVSELRKLFSPGKLIAGSTKLNKNLQDCSRNAALPERSKTQQKFKHVVSPIAQYIKGNEAT